MASIEPRSQTPHAPVAPAWHTAVVIAIMLTLSIVSARAGNLPGTGGHQRVRGYCIAMIVEWGTTGFIWYGLRGRSIKVSELVGGSWVRPVYVLRDIGLAIGFLLVAAGVLNGLGYLLKAAPNQAMRNMFPEGAAQVIAYLLLVLTAGFCEELIFRGYLQRQFTALTGTVAGGIVLQGILFGASHGYQGWKFMLVIAVFGTMFGVLALWRRSLRPGMIAHFLQDGVGGLLGRYIR
jgi:membrane protease YdiL (CAAX protease family)